MGSSATVVSSGPSSTLSMIQSIARSWQKKSENQIDQDISALKANAPTMDSGSVFIGRTSSSKFQATLIQTGLNRAVSSDEAINQAWASNLVESDQEEFTRENSMTSQEIYQALYSGSGLPHPSGQGSVSFGSIFQEMMTGENPNIVLVGQIGQAMASGTLKIEKASEASGLGYKEVFTTAAFGQGSSGSNDESWNRAATGNTVDKDQNIIANVAGDGKRHLLINPTGMLGIYLSW